MASTIWMTEYAVAKYFGFNHGRYIRGWNIPHLSVLTQSGRTVRRYKRSDVEVFERANSTQQQAG